MWYVVFENQYNGEFARTKHQNVRSAYSFWKYMRKFAYQSGWKRIYIMKVAQS